MATRQANDAVASERSSFSDNRGYKSFSPIGIFRGLDALGGRTLRTDTHTYTHSHTHGTTTVTLPAIFAPRVNYGFTIIISGG